MVIIQLKKRALSCWLSIIAACSALCACSCPKAMLTVYTDYISIENLASYYVNTPDPRLDNPPIGQRLIISWSVPKWYSEKRDLHLELTMRFRQREESVQNIPITKKAGTYVYALMNDDYRATRGILTYKIELKAGDELLQCWVHQIWTELIQIQHTPSTIEEEDLNKDF